MCVVTVTVDHFKAMKNAAGQRVNTLSFRDGIHNHPNQQFVAFDGALVFEGALNALVDAVGHHNKVAK